MTREDYERYAAAFNARDYDAVFDFYAENPRMAFFGTSKEYGATPNGSTQSGVPQELQNHRHRQADDVRMRTVDSLDETARQPLNGVGAGLVARFAGRNIVLDV